MVYLTVTALTILINTSLGAFVYFRNPKGAPNREFALLILSLVGWTATLYFYYLISDPLPLLFVGRLNFALATPISLFFLRFALVFPKETLKVPKIAVYSLTFLTTLMGLLSMFTPLVDKQEIAQGTERIVVYGQLWPILIFVFIANFILAVLIIILKIKRSEGLSRVQLLYLLIGFFLLFFLAVITNLILPTLHNFKIQQFGPMFTIFFVAFTAYTIVKHRLLSIRMLVARSVAFAALVVLVASIYAVSIFYISSKFFGTHFDTTLNIIYIALALFIAFSFQPLSTIIKKTTDRFLYKSDYDPSLLLSAANSIMALNLELEDITGKVLKELLASMHIEKGAVYIFGNDAVFQKTIIGSENKNLYDDKTLIALAKRPGIIIAQEEEDQILKKTLEKNNFAIALPLYVGDKQHGLLLLGEKQSGEIFTEADIQFLQILSPSFAVAVQNSKSYEEIKRFNITLQTKIKAATAQLQKANNKLKELDKLKDDFVSVASHELRTPMTAIKGFISMIQEGDYGQVNEKVEKVLADVAISTDGLISLVNDMLNISRIEAGRLKFTLAEFKLADVAGQITSNLAPIAKDKKITLTAPNLGTAVVYADEQKTREIINNLLGNALKFTNQGGQITLSTKLAGDLIWLSVADTGMGIGPKDQKKLFGKFQQISAQKSGRPPGTGLGLYISRELARRMGGDVWLVESTLGRGSTFAFSLPRAKTALASPP